MKTKISIITVVYNDKNGLEKTIKSVIEQTYNNVQYIVIDGGSTDGTIDIIKKFENKISFWKSEPDNGIYDAMNKGINIATGTWINFMNAGDTFVDNYVLDKLEQYFESNNDVIFGDSIIKQLNNYYISKASPSQIGDYKSLTQGFFHQSSFVKNGLAKKHPFDLKYKFVADFNMMVTLYHENARFVYTDFPIAFYDTNGTSSHHIFQCRIEALKIRNRYPGFINKMIAMYLLSTNYLRIFVRNCIKLVSSSWLECYYKKKKDWILIGENVQMIKKQP